MKKRLGQRAARASHPEKPWDHFGLCASKRNIRCDVFWHYFCQFVQRWKTRLREEDQLKMDMVSTLLDGCVTSPLAMTLSRTWENFLNFCWSCVNR